MAGFDNPLSTASLLARVRNGDGGARNQLCAQYLPILMRWAHGRLPQQARDLSETSDLVQITLTRALAQVDRFQHHHEGAFLAYLRSALLNTMRNEIQRSLRHGETIPIDELHTAAPDSHLAQAIGQELLIDYERGLFELTPEWREAVLLRLEFGFSYAEIAAAMERPSEDAARMLVHRALAELRNHMHRDMRDDA